MPIAGQKRPRQVNGDPVPHLGPDANPGGARVCEEHPGKLECTGKRSGLTRSPRDIRLGIEKGTGLQCHGPAVRGTDKCARHGGKSRQDLMTQGEAQITAWMAIGSPPPGGHIDSGMAVLGMLQMSWLRAAAYGNLLRQQVDKEGGDLDVTGLIGQKTGAAGQEGFLYAQSEEIRSLVQLEASERDRVVKYAETAHKMGISNRLTSLAERWGDVVASRISAMLLDLNLTPDQEMIVGTLITKHLSSIDMMSIEA